MATLQDTMNQRKAESSKQISNLYDKQFNSQAAQLKTAYDQNVSNAQAAQQKIAPQYQTQANAMAAQYERNRRNMNLQNMNAGMGTGTAAQQQEALNNRFQQNYTGLRNQEAAAQTEAGQKMVDLGVAYQNNLAQERMNTENKKAAAQIENTNTLNNWYDQQAKLKAGYGDFSGYESLYGKQAADQMKNVWIIQNPDVALGAGMIDAARYQQITGHAPGVK